MLTVRSGLRLRIWAPNWAQQQAFSPAMNRPAGFSKAQCRENAYEPLSADPETPYERVIEINLSSLEPMAACPSSPDNIAPFLNCRA